VYTAHRIEKNTHFQWENRPSLPWQQKLKIFTLLNKFNKTDLGYTADMATGSGADSIGDGGHVPPPHFYRWLGAGGTVSRRTANKKLTKLYRPSQKRSPKRLIVLLETKKWRTTTKKFFPADRNPSPTFKFVLAPLAMGFIT